MQVNGCKKLKLNEAQHTTLYKNNSRDSNKFKVCSLLLNSCIKIVRSFEFGYYSYVCREAMNGN